MNCAPALHSPVEMVDASVDAACRNPDARATRAYVAKLRTTPISDRKFLVQCALSDYANLCRCALDADTPADATRDGVTALCAAAQNGSARVMEVLLSRGASHAFRDSEQRTPLHYAAYFPNRGSAACVCILCAYGADKEARDHHQWTPLLLAAHKQNNEAVIALLEAGANVEAATPHVPGGKSALLTSLHKASMANSLVIMQALLAKGASPEGACPDSTPLVDAVSKGHLDAGRLLIEAGAQIDRVSAVCGGQTALNRACLSGNERIVKLLLAKGANPNVAEATLQHSCLMQAVLGSHVGIVRRLLRKGADFRKASADGRTALHNVVAVATSECFDAIMEYVSDEDIDLRTSPGVLQGWPTPFHDETPLKMACSFGNFHAAKELLRLGASRTAVDTQGRTPLHETAAKGHLGCLVLLLGKPASPLLTPEDVNARDVIGRTALHYAAISGEQPCIGPLLSFGADPRAVDHITRHTPYDLALKLHPTNRELHQLLLVDAVASGDDAEPLPGMSCACCGATEHLRACSGCLAVRSCGLECAASNWSAHKAVCRQRQKAKKGRAKVNSETEWVGEQH
jgi:serine/threonine-protein phosphatase 6 regulatory ankyrin repeat subunit A